MLDLDQELFQTIVLGGLLLLLLVLLVVLVTLSSIRKALEEASARASFTDGGYGSALPQEQQHQQQPQAQPEPFQQQPAAAQAWQAEATQAASPPVDTTPGAAAPAPRAQEAMPEEQPFEREGRWWYKRGNELLLYEEQQGQWVPAPEGALGGAASGGAESHSVASAFQSITQAGPAQGQPGQAQAGQAQPGGSGERQDSGNFWKCPSCGAVNGSTAASCRMCFTARP